MIGHFSRLNSVLSNPGRGWLNQSMNFSCVTLAFLRRCGQVLLNLSLRVPFACPPKLV